MKKRSVFAGLAGLLASASAMAQVVDETIVYRYDAKGRLIRIVRTGTVNPNVRTDFTHDRANNRRVKKVTGAP